MIYELRSKLTGKIQTVDGDIYDKLVNSGVIKKFTIIQTHTPKRVIPEEIIQKTTKKVVKEDITLNDKK